jgi:hypothetical protein
MQCDWGLYQYTELHFSLTNGDRAVSCKFVDYSGGGLVVSQNPRTPWPEHSLEFKDFHFWK